MKCDSSYANLGPVFRRLVRNGLAHNFLAKPGILVTKFTNNKISIDIVKQELYVDCNVLFNDFRLSYTQLVKPIIFSSCQVPRFLDSGLLMVCW